MSQVVHTVCETQAFHLSGQTCSPAYERQREPWASAPAPPSGRSPASLRQLRNRPERALSTTSKQPSSCIKSTHFPEGSSKHTVSTTASQSSFFVPVGQEMSLLTDTYREIKMSGYLKKFHKNLAMSAILPPCSWPHR